MTNDGTLAEVVWAWATEMLPDHGNAADGAAAVARQAFCDGASVTEACHAARSFLQSWVNHPAHWVADNQLRLVS